MANNGKVNLVHLFGLILNNDQTRLRAELLLLEPSVNRQFKYELKRLQMATARFQEVCQKLHNLNYEEIEDLAAEIGEQQDFILEGMFKNLDHE